MGEDMVCRGPGGLLPYALAMALPLSIAIVCCNNARTIGRTLESVAGLGAEIVAVDSGSTDGTLDLLEGVGARIIRTQWRGFVATKQMALEACGQPWVFAIDSDESLLPELRKAVQQALVGDPPEIAGYEVNRQVWYRGRPLRHTWQPEWRLRLVRRQLAAWAGLEPHDYLTLRPGSARGRLAGVLRHDSIGSFAEFAAKQAVHARVMAESLHRTGKRGRLSALVTSSTGAFLKQLIVKQGWRDGWPGWLAAASMASAALTKHAILIELTRTTGGAGPEVDPRPGAAAPDSEPLGAPPGGKPP
jgi:hypothetical protein